uniref:Uncharacterized protein n=1 Tax=Arundo donax TaxID=35708 RepID=A0A0A9BFE9_ARUDO
MFAYTHYVVMWFRYAKLSIFLKKTKQNNKTVYFE